MANRSLITQAVVFPVLHLIVSAFALMATSAIVPDFRITSFGGAILTVMIIGLFSAFLRPLLLFFALPFNLLTLGLFTFVINGAVLKIAASVSPGFTLGSWSSAILGAFVLSVLNTLLHLFFI